MEVALSCDLPSNTTRCAIAAQTTQKVVHPAWHRRRAGVKRQNQRTTAMEGTAPSREEAVAGAASGMAYLLIRGGILSSSTTAGKVTVEVHLKDPTRRRQKPSSRPRAHSTSAVSQLASSNQP
ncbi:hypothetical protein PC116_g6836 [Phytophthora cactorum]|uniref:Uncharacterized protein n=1 Tax=Phytophthora cactorum TaxID=29920 RepID=A0A8T1LCB5_9STRA|nr:hypothetical protein Pcac1_g10537 [Phytophthora cactorum]KAG2839364.1 hypothetical protein PC112_g4127 [Phytophthora cactorum]KAG2924603.1 hypothetical protein PC114_g4413 [Phytophthora cactorum]KAG2950768.1 hypothetical protein PC117_g4164 [Phytophthora cactorum]KAG3032059.1 hypothetical protein PC120_g2712 [Phytophthora cactorum]